MNSDYRYTMLICSLPRHGPPFAAQRPVVSRIRLKRAMSMLDEQDHAEYTALMAVLNSSGSDANVLAAARKALPGLHNVLARELLMSQLEIRSLLAALRRRQRGEARPAAHSAWGYGRWTALIEQRWSEADFGLGRVYPWLNEARALLAAGESLALERLIIEVQWAELEQRALGHEFDFEAVLIYVLRWQLVARWTHYHPQGAHARFDHLTREALQGVDLSRLHGLDQAGGLQGLAA